MAYNPITQCPYICNVDLLWHPDHKSRPVTLDYTGTDGVIKAGTPISAAGAVANNGNAIGILLRDSYDGFHVAGSVVIDGFIRQDVAEEHSGVQLTDDAKRAMSKLVFVDAEGVPDPPAGGGSTVPKPLTYDYMPEGYPSKSVETVTIMAEQEVEFTLTEGIYTAASLAGLELIVGRTYTVNWDGTEYECVCVAAYETTMIGNLSIAGAGDDTGEPFLYGTDIGMGTLDTSATHTISVKTTGEISTPMAEEFLPNIPADKLPEGVIITGDVKAETYSSNVTYDEMYKRLLAGAQVVLHIVSGEPYYIYLTTWTPLSGGGIRFLFQDLNLTMRTNGTIT